MVLGPNDNHPDNKVKNGDILDVEDDVITTSQESSPTVQLGGGTQSVGAARRNSSLPTPTDELSNLRELDKDLRAPKPDGSRRGSYDESYPHMLTHPPPSLTPISNLSVNMDNMHEPRRSMAGTFTVNTYTRDDSLLALRENMEFGQGRSRRSRHSSNMSNWSDSTQSLQAAARMRSSVKRGTRGYLGTPAEENRASLVHAVPLYDEMLASKLMGRTEGERGSAPRKSLTGEFIDSYDSSRRWTLTGSKTPSPLKLSPLTDNHPNNSYRLSALGGSRRRSEPLARVAGNIMETSSLPTTLELPEPPSQPPGTLSKKPALPQIQSERQTWLEKLPSIEDTFEEENIVSNYLVPSSTLIDQLLDDKQPIIDHVTDQHPIRSLVSDSRFIDELPIETEAMDELLAREVIFNSQPVDDHITNLPMTAEFTEDKTIGAVDVESVPTVQESVIESRMVEGDQPIAIDTQNGRQEVGSLPLTRRVSDDRSNGGRFVIMTSIKDVLQESEPVKRLSLTDQPIRSQDVDYQPIERQDTNSQHGGLHSVDAVMLDIRVVDSQLMKFQVADGQPPDEVESDLESNNPAGQPIEDVHLVKDVADASHPKDATRGSRQQEKGTWIHFGELVQLEGQLGGRYYRHIDNYLDLAVALALTDMIKIHTYNGALLKTGSLSLSNANLNVIHEHLSDEKKRNSGYADVACQCYLSEAVDVLQATPLHDLSVLAWSPASHTHCDPHAADQASQCDVMSAREKESSGLTPTMQVKPEVTSYVTGGTTSVSVSCSLPHPSTSPTRGVAPLLEEFVASHVKKTTEKRLSVSSETAAKLKSSLLSRFVPALKMMVSSTGKVVTNQQMVNWLKAVNMLDTADVCLNHLLPATFKAYKEHYALNMDYVPLPHMVGRRRGMYHMSTYEIISPKLESDRGSRGYSKQWQTTPYDRRLSSRVDENLISIVLDNYKEVKKLLVGPTKKETLKTSTPVGNSPSASMAKPAEWKKAAKKAMKLKRLLLSAVAKRRITFLHQLLENMSEDEQHLVHAMFAAANPSESEYISVIEVCLLLSAATGSKFSVPNCRKIIGEIDVDGDGRLSLIDILSVLYLTDLYFVALADGFRTLKVAELSLSFTASHALVYIALSQLCHANKLKLNEENNILIKIANVESAQCGETYIDQSQLPKTSSPALFSMSFLGRGNAFLDQMAVRLMDSTRVRMGELWSPSQFILPVHKRPGNALIYPVLDNQLSLYPRTPYMVKKNTALTRQPVPPIHFKGENINFDPLSIYSNAGLDMFHRKKSTSYGIEERSHRPAGIIAMREIRNLANKPLKIANLFLETSLFNSRKYRELVAVFKSNQLKLWPADVVQTGLAHPRHGATKGPAEVKDLSLDIYHVLTSLKGTLKDPSHTNTDNMLQ